ncbi:MAG: GPO family capsid scaffolding protein [Azoarcus sp.]|nr:GPO family capsid scaffolding protein [Azoarcus sp.]
MPITKPFVIATEGNTTDGRVIMRQQIADMAKNYDPKIYTAVVNLDHYISFDPDSVFSAYGKVVSLTTQETNIFGQNRLQLLAVADVSEQAAKFQREGKKAFASIEIMPNFTGAGIPYLTGLALTDHPASLGTEAMKFSAFPDGEQHTCAAEIEIELSAVPDQKTQAPEKPAETLFDRVKNLLFKTDASAEARFTEHANAIEILARSCSQIQTSITDFATRLSRIETGAAAQAAAFAALTEKLSGQPAAPDTRRPAATGGIAGQTDC